MTEAPILPPPPPPPPPPTAFTARVLDAAIRNTGLAPAPIRGGVAPKHATVSPAKKPPRSVEEEFKEQELARISCGDAYAAKVKQAEEEEEEEQQQQQLLLQQNSNNKSDVQPRTRVAVRLNVGLGSSPEKQRPGSQWQPPAAQPGPPTPPSPRQTGVVAGVNRSARTVDVVYDTGDKDYSVPLEFIDLVSSDDEAKFHRSSNNNNNNNNNNQSASGAEDYGEYENEKEADTIYEDDDEDGATTTSSSRRMSFAKVHDEEAARRAARRGEAERLHLERQRRERQARAALEREVKLLRFQTNRANATTTSSPAGSGRRDWKQQQRRQRRQRRQEEEEEEEEAKKRRSDDDDDDDDDVEAKENEEAEKKWMSDVIPAPSPQRWQWGVGRADEDADEDAETVSSDSVSDSDSDTSSEDLERIVEAASAPSPTNMAWTRPDVGFLESDDDTEFDAADMYRWSHSEAFSLDGDEEEDEEDKDEREDEDEDGTVSEKQWGDEAYTWDQETEDSEEEGGNDDQPATTERQWDARYWDREDEEVNSKDEEVQPVTYPASYAYLEEEEEAQGRGVPFHHAHQRQPPRQGRLSGFDSFYEDEYDVNSKEEEEEEEDEDEEDEDLDEEEEEEEEEGVVPWTYDEHAAAGRLGRVLLGLSLMEFEAPFLVEHAVEHAALGMARAQIIADEVRADELTTTEQGRRMACRPGADCCGGDVRCLPSYSGDLEDEESEEDDEDEESLVCGECDDDYEVEDPNVTANANANAGGGFDDDDDDDDDDNFDDGEVSDASSGHPAWRVHPYSEPTGLSPPKRRSSGGESSYHGLSPPSPGSKDRQGIHVTGVPWITVSSELPPAAYLP